MRQRALAAVIAAAIVAACNSPATPAPSGDAVANASPSVAAGSAGPSPSPSPSTVPTPTPAPTATPVPTPTPTATPAPTPPPWKIYTSKRYHYKIKYPPDWIVTPGTTKYADQFDNFGLPFVTVFRDVVTTRVDVPLTVSHETAYYKTHYKAKLLSNKAISLAGGFSGRILTFSGVDNGLKETIQVVIVAKGKVGYFIDLFADQTTEQADKALFKTMYRSWRPTS